MYLKQLKVHNFKNYKEAGFELSPKINCFVGDNGEGKTNVLDAVYYLSFCKSYFNPVDTQNILHGEDFFAINGYYDRRKKPPIIFRARCGKTKRRSLRETRRSMTGWPTTSD
ncbi:MAG: AAA family ATPase [Bacteroidales bacterium]|nr:AAA family ATPase [Bacteroidales bacterium]